MKIKNTALPILRMAAIHCILTVCVTVLLYFFANSLWAISFFSGGLFFAVDLMILGLSWAFIFSKKFIALAVGVSVFKFTILGIILYRLIVGGGLNALLFGAGCAAFAITALVESLFNNTQVGKNNVV